MSENSNQLEQLIKVELLGVMTRIAEISIQKGLDEEQEEKFIKLFKNIIDNQITLAWGITKLVNKLDKKTPQDVRDQGEQVVLDVQASVRREQVIKSLAKSLSCEIDIEKII